MSSTFEISVIISTYDDRDLIPKKLAEIKAQTFFEHAEFLFIEPDSPGKERELLEPFCRENPNCRLLALDERINLYQAWNLGWSEAQAPLVCITNMDDSMHPRLMEAVISGMSKEGWDIATVLIAKQPFDETSDDWSPSRIHRLELSTRPGPFFVWRKELIERLGAFDDSLQIVGDKDFWARAQDRKLRIGLLPFVGYLNTFHSNQLSKSADASRIKRIEREICSQKTYPHVWPEMLSHQIRRIRVLRRLPFWGRRYLLPHDLLC